MAKKAFICEFPRQLPEAVKAASEGWLVVSVDPESSRGLDKAGAAYVEQSELCPHEEFWKRYPELAGRTLSLSRELDRLARSRDHRLGAADLNFFDAVHYILKIEFDQILYRVHTILELAKRGVTEIVYPDRGKGELDEYGMLTPHTSVFPAVVKVCGATGVNFVGMDVSDIREAGSDGKSRFSFGQPLQFLKHNLGRSALSFLRSISRKGPSGSGKVLISVGCKEVDALFKKYPMEGYQLVGYDRYESFLDPHPSWKYLNEFMSDAARSATVREMTTHEGMCFFDALALIVEFLAEKIDLVLASRKRIFKYLDEICPHGVFFHTQAPFYVPNITVREYCLKNSIPYFTWMHGGYGAYPSLQGYDVVDYRLCERQVVYGPVLRNLVSNPDNVLAALGLAGKTKEVVVGGSPFFDAMYAGVQRPKSTGKTVLFSLGNYYHHNSFYFGHDRPQSEMSIWKSHVRILEELARFRDEYRIVVKDYPGTTHKDMWRDIVAECGSGKIEYVTTERPFDKVLSAADVHVFTWVSTTFIQSLYTDADILLYDDTVMTEESRSLFEKDILFSPDLEGFCDKLSGYLEEGRLYRQDKTRLRENFLDYSNKERRDMAFQECLRSFA